MRNLQEVKSKFYNGKYFVNSETQIFDIKEEMKSEIKDAIKKDIGSSFSKAEEIFEKCWVNPRNYSMMDVFIDIEEEISSIKNS